MFAIRSFGKLLNSVIEIVYSKGESVSFHLKAEYRSEPNRCIAIILNIIDQIKNPPKY